MELVLELNTVLVAQSITTVFVVTQGPLVELVNNHMDASLCILITLCLKGSASSDVYSLKF